MATKQSRALRSKQKAKAARIHKQKNQAIFSHDESNEAYEIISPKTIEMFESLPNPTVPKDGTAPITFLPPLVQGFLKTYDHEKISEDNIDRLVDAVLVAVGLYLYWGTSGNRGLGSNGTKNQRKKNIRTFHRIALKSSGTETYASKMPL